MTRLLMLLVALPLLFLAGCANDSNATAERREFERRMEERIGHFQQRILEARERAEGLSGEAREQMDESIKDLEERLGDLEDQLDQMRESADGQWEAVRDKAEEAASELERSFNEFRQNSGHELPLGDLARRP